MKFKKMFFIGSLLFLMPNPDIRAANNQKAVSLSRKDLVQAAVKFVRRKPLTFQERAALKKMAISGAFIAVVTAITGLSAAYIKNRLAAAKREDVDFQKEYKVTGISIKTIADKYGETIPIDNSPVALIVRAALGGSIDMVKQFTDLVNLNVLNIAREVVEFQIDNHSDRKAAVYRQIKMVLSNAIINFSEPQFLKNMRFIHSATTGLFEEVIQNICKDSVKPSRNAIAEALEQLKEKSGSTFEEIRRFLRNPRCSG